MEQGVYDVASQAGEFLLEAADILFPNGEGIDVINQIDSLNVYEDIYSPFITGKIVFRDTLDLPAALGRGGRDVLRLSVTTRGIPDQDRYYIKGYFHIYKFGERTMIGDRMQQYTFYFTQVEALTDLNTQISGAFSGTGDQIFKTICKKYFNDQTKGMITDASVEPIKFISNYWSPSKCISYAAEHSRTAGKDSQFLFYENRDGFNFRTIGSICAEKDKPIQVFQENDFSANIITNGPMIGTTDRNPNKDYQVVQAIRVKCVYDYIDARSSGALKQRMTMYDLLKKTHSIVEYGARDTTKLNEYPLYTQDVVNSTSVQPMTKAKHYGVNDMGNVTNANYWQSRVSDVRLLNTSKIEIDVFGRTDYTVGRVVYYDSNIKAAITSDDTPDTYEDKLYSGYYVITAINHRFSRSQHFCTLELSKESSKSK